MVFVFIGSIIVGVLMISILVLVHEWGHFIVARKSGIKVEEFSIGFPPRAKKLFTDKHGTLFSLGWLPFGGFVRLFGEDAHDPTVLKDHQSFASKSLWVRIAVVVAGVVMNFLMGFAILWVMFMIGTKPFLLYPTDFEYYRQAGVIETLPGVLVGQVFPESPAALAGIKSGDVLVSFNGKPIDLTEQLLLWSSEQKGKTAQYEVRRGNEALTLAVHLTAEGKAGISVVKNEVIHEVQYNPAKALAVAGSESVRISYFTLRSITGMIVKFVTGVDGAADGIAGPVGVAIYTYRSLQEGLSTFLRIAASLSFSLAVINILPIPALDGGRLFFLLLEGIRRKPIPAKYESVVHACGFLLLLALMVAVVVLDFYRWDQFFPPQ